MVSILLAALLQAATTGHWSDDIETRDWKPTSGNDNMLVYAQPGPPGQSPGYVRQWERFEFRVPEKTSDGFYYSSRVTLAEYDCRGQRNRAIHSTLYKERNLLGEAKSHNFTLLAWDFSPPGTIGARLLKTACPQ